MNVLLISIDSLRADHVGAYGYPRATTPTIDRMAAEGVVFTNAISTSPWTLPAHAALLTGTYDDRHGATVPTNRIDPSLTTLADAFREDGYFTAGFYSGPFLHPHFGFARGFEEYVDCTSYRLEKIENPSATRIHKSSHRDITNPRIAENFGGALTRYNAERPFFFFVHMWDVHYDLIPPPPYDRMFADPDMPADLPRDYRHDAGFVPGMDDAAYRGILALYDGEIRFTDDTIARILASLESRGLLDNTLVVITSDHGDEFLEHGSKGHKRTLFQEVLHVPLVIWAKKTLKPLRVAETVSLVDVAPTITALAGINGLEEADGQPIFDNDGKLDTSPRIAIAELRNQPRQPRLAAAVSHPLKVLRDFKTGQFSLYDLRLDPGELSPMEVSGDAAEKLRASLDAHYSSAKRPRSDSSKPPKALPKGMTNRLRELGYLD